MSSDLYFNGRLCSGRGRSVNEYTKKELLDIAKSNDIKIPRKLPKREICQILLHSNIQNIPEIPQRRVLFRDMDHLMEYLEVDDARELVKLSEKETEDLIDLMNLYKGTTTMKEHLKDYRGSERVKQLLIELAGKFCRCLKAVEAKQNEYGVLNPTAVCSASIFTSKGLKGPGRNFQCDPTPLLLPSGYARLSTLNKNSKEYKEARYILTKTKGNK